MTRYRAEEERTRFHTSVRIWQWKLPFLALMIRMVLTTTYHAFGIWSKCSLKFSTRLNHAHQAGYNIGGNETCSLHKLYHNQQTPVFLLHFEMTIRGGFWSSIIGYNDVKANYSIPFSYSSGTFPLTLMKEQCGGREVLNMNRWNGNSEVDTGKVGSFQFPDPSWPRPHFCLESEVRQRWQQLWKLRRTEALSPPPAQAVVPEPQVLLPNHLLLGNSCWNRNTWKGDPSISYPTRRTVRPEMPWGHRYEGGKRTWFEERPLGFLDRPRSCSFPFSCCISVTAFLPCSRKHTNTQLNPQLQRGFFFLYLQLKCRYKNLRLNCVWLYRALFPWF